MKKNKNPVMEISNTNLMLKVAFNISITGFFKKLLKIILIYLLKILNSLNS